ncbi:hypothetical protein CDAR_63481 [Caerostris darwini]|uniref:Uncharacterized protein n=1 Tax=Caerostris darwini TaxID=1538125 RepID=A0AAV4QD76_9ARAC|nr:hypothetical protein CDAR_63481 [Caerostris darwini]
MKFFQFFHFPLSLAKVNNFQFQNILFPSEGSSSKTGSEIPLSLSASVSLGRKSIPPSIGNPAHKQAQGPAPHSLPAPPSLPRNQWARSSAAIRRLAT